MTWVFHESDPMGGAAGEAYAKRPHVGRHAA